MKNRYKLGFLLPAIVFFLSPQRATAQNHSQLSTSRVRPTSRSAGRVSIVFGVETSDPSLTVPSPTRPACKKAYCVDQRFEDRFQYVQTDFISIEPWSTNCVMKNGRCGLNTGSKEYRRDAKGCAEIEELLSRLSKRSEQPCTVFNFARPNCASIVTVLGNGPSGSPEKASLLRANWPASWPAIRISEYVAAVFAVQSWGQNTVTAVTRCPRSPVRPASSQWRRRVRLWSDNHHCSVSVSFACSKAAFRVESPTAAS